MKKAILILLTIYTSVAHAQYFPMSIKSGSVDLYNRIMMDGLPIDGAFTQAPGTYAFNGTSVPETDGSTTVTSAIGMVDFNTTLLYVKDYTISSTAQAAFQMQAGFLNSAYNFIVNAGETKIIPMDAIIWPKGTIAAGLKGLVRPTNPAGNALVLLSGFRVWETTVDFFNAITAPKKALIIGDSNTEGGAVTSTYPTDTTTNALMWQYRLKSWYEKNGVDIGIFQKARGGKSTVDFEKYRENHLLDMAREDLPDIVFYNLGTNNYDTTIYRQNIHTFLGWAPSYNGYATATHHVKIVMLAPAPKQGSSTITGTSNPGTYTNETILGWMRHIMQEEVAKCNNPNIIYINTGNAWNVNDNSQYSTTEADGSHVHWSLNGGHGSFANYIETQISTYYPSFKTLQ